MRLSYRTTVGPETLPDWATLCHVSLGKSLFGWLVAITVGCASQGQPPPPQDPQPSRIDEVRARSPSETAVFGEDAEYIPSDRSLAEAQIHLGGMGRALIEGFRVAPGEPACREVTNPPLRGGVELPSRFGSGFVFWNDTELYRSNRFAGPLTPLARLPMGRRRARIERLSLGPSEILIHLVQGGRLVWSLKDGWKAQLPRPGIIDLCAEQDGPAAMLTEPGELWLRAAGSLEYQKVDDPSLEILGLEMVAGRIVVHGSRQPPVTSQLDINPADTIPSTSVSYVLDSRGVLAPIGSELEAVLRRVAPEHLPGAHAHFSPRRWALQQGIALGPGIAVVERSGVLLQVDLRTGKISRKVKLPLFPPKGTLEPRSEDCQLLPLGQEIIGLCPLGGEQTEVIAGISSLTPRIERSFQGQGRFFTGVPGVLLREGPCQLAAEPNQSAVCVRDQDGSWKEHRFEPSRLPFDRESNQPAKIARWVPTVEGRAIGLVAEPTPGWFDLERSSFTPFRGMGQEIASQLLVTSSAGPADARASWLSDGSLVVLGSARTVKLFRDGRWQPLSWGTVRARASFANRALGEDESGQLWQSTDYGLTWQAIRAPPSRIPDGDPHARRKPAPRSRGELCSDVGCVFGDWYRLGYPESPPIAAPFDEPEHPSLAEPPHARPRLVCEASDQPHYLTSEADERREPVLGGALVPWTPKRKALRSVSSQWELSFLANDPSPFTSSGWMRADALLDPQPWDTEESPPRATKQRVRLDYQIPLRSPKISTTHFSLGELTSALRQIGRTRDLLNGAEDGQAIPLLSARSRVPDRLLLFAEPCAQDYALVVGENQPTRIFVPQKQPLHGTLTSAISTHTNGVVVLEETANSRQIRQILPQEKLLMNSRIPSNSTPGQPDTLAIANDGEPTLLRMWSFGPPSAGDPAMILRDHQPPKFLAPWASLTEGPCEAGAGLRAIVNLDDWIEIRIGEQPAGILGPIRALIDWSEQRLCLMALELDAEVPDLSESRPSQAQIYVPFDGKSSAVRYLFGVGQAYREEMTCRLEKGGPG